MAIMITNFDSYMEIINWAKINNLSISAKNDKIIYTFNDDEFMSSTLVNNQLDISLNDLRGNKGHKYVVNTKTISLLLDLIDEQFDTLKILHKKRLLNPLYRKPNNETMNKFFDGNSEEFTQNNRDELALLVESLITYHDEIDSAKEEFAKKKDTLELINKKDDFIIDNYYNRLGVNLESVITNVNAKVSSLGLENAPYELYMKNSVRLMNSLKRAGIFTFKDLLSLKPSQIVKIRNLGFKSFKELVYNLNQFSEQLEVIEITDNENFNIYTDTPAYFEKYLHKMREIYGNQPQFQNKKIIEYPLSVRVTNSLMSAGVMTMEILSTKDWFFFTRLSNFGRKSFKELRDFIYNTYDVTINHNSIIADTPKIPYKITPKLIGTIDLENANYSFAYMVHEHTFDKLKSYEVETVNDFLSLNDEHPLFLDKEICNDFELYNIITILSTPLETYIHLSYLEILNSLSSTHRDIILMRSQGLTLEAIGIKYNITRERVRQICSKVIRKANMKRQFDQIIHLLNIITYGTKYCKKNVLESVFGEYFLSFIWFFNDSYDVVFEALFLSNSVKDDVLNVVNEINETIYLKDFHDEFKSHEYFDLINNYIKNKYIVMKNFAFKNSPTYIDLYTITIKEKFEYMQISDETELSKFKQYYFELFGDENIFNKTSRSITAILQRLPGISMRGRGEYYFKENEINPDLLKAMHETIQTHKTISFRGLFNIYRDEFLKNGISNHFQLHTVVKKQLPSLYTNRDNVSIIEVLTIDIDSAISNYIGKEEGIFTFNSIKQSIPDVTELHLFSHVEQYRDAISIFNRKYIPCRLLKYSDDDKMALSDYIDHILIKEGIITSQRLYLEILGEHFSSLVSKNHIDNAHFAYQFTRFLLKDEYSFEFNCIYYKDQPSMKQLDFLLKRFINSNRILIKDIVTYANQNFISIQNMKALLDNFYESGFMRLDNEVIIKTKLIQVPKSFIVELENLIEDSLVGETLSTIDIETFERFPKVSIPWNEHLLAHLIKNHSEKYYVIDIGNQYNKLSYLFKENENE